MILASHGIIASSVNSSTLINGLISAYNADNSTVDSYGSYNGVAVGGLTYATGKFGDSFQFNGTNSYVSLPNITNQLNFTSDFSVSLWVNFNSVEAPYEVLFSNYKSGTPFGTGFQIYLDITGLKLELYNNSAGNCFLSTFSPTINTWYHLVATRKSSTESKMYINNVSQNGSYPSGNQTTNQTYQTGQQYNIGASLGATFSNIRMDSINIYNRVLTSTEVSELYTKQYPF
jgi:hypothetical protein